MEATISPTIFKKKSTAKKCRAHLRSKCVRNPFTPGVHYGRGYKIIPLEKVMNVHNMDEALR